MLNGEQVEQLADMFRLLGEPNRLSLVVRCLDAPQGVGQLALATGLAQSLVSHHLRLLRAGRLLRAMRDGKQVYYAMADAHVRETLVNMIDHIVEPHHSGAEDNEGADP